jgi:gamma-butyrobetaine dioxygenase
LLYFKDPPHVQLLHCVQSASTGGASVFADGYKAALDLFHEDIEAFHTLATIPVNYHYTHPDSNVYHTTKPVIDLLPLRIGETTYAHISDYIRAWNETYNPQGQSDASTDKLLVGLMQKINWGPPFLAPFSNHEPHAPQEDALSVLNDKVERWHSAAQKYNALLQRPEYLYERTMKSGECVLFDNTRTLHSRRAFEKADMGKPRWLRGTYVDRDAYLSSVRVLNRKYGRRS